MLNPGETILTVCVLQRHSALLTSEGRVFIWGYNNDGQLGNGTTISSYSPIEITDMFDLNEGEKITNISIGFSHSAALTSEGRLFTWGDNEYGQLGDATNIDKYTPAEITSQFNLNEGESISVISLGYGYSSAITSTGRVFTWGSNSAGQLGDGTTSSKYTPTEITSQFSLAVGETIIKISLADDHSAVLTSFGRIFTWGENGLGQLGDGTTNDSIIAIEITSQFNLNVGETIIDISLGDTHSSAITSEGRVFTWGSNNYGQLGDGSTTRSYIPLDITSQFGFDQNKLAIDILLGVSNSMIITSDNRVFVWGYNDSGCLGDGTIIDRHVPIELTVFYLYQFDIYNFNEAIVIPTDPVRVNYTFGGWYLDSACLTEYVFSTMPAEDITLYVKWVSE